MDNRTKLHNRLWVSVMKNIYVVGGCGLAAEYYIYIEELSKIDNNINFGGFLGFEGFVADFKSLNKLFKGDVSEHKFEDNDYIVIGSGDIKLRQKIYSYLKKNKIKLYNLITKNSYIPDYIEIGEGNVFYDTQIISPHIKIGNCNIFNGKIVVGHDVIIGNMNFFGPNSILLGNVSIKDNNSVGAGSVLLPKAKIGNNNTIAPLSAVYKGCKNDSYLLGNPAMKM